MTLEEAYLRCKHECMALKRENAKLSETVEKLRKGTYSEPEKIAHIRKISELTRKLQEQEKLKGRYKTLYENEQENSYSLYEKINTLEEKNRSLQWQVDCLEGKRSRQSISPTQFISERWLNTDRIGGSTRGGKSSIVQSFHPVYNPCIR